MLDVLMVWNGL
jgi:hypothetical protein